MPINPLAKAIEVYIQTPSFLINNPTIGVLEELHALHEALGSQTTKIPVAPLLAEAGYRFPNLKRFKAENPLWDGYLHFTEKFAVISAQAGDHGDDGYNGGDNPSDGTGKGSSDGKDGGDSQQGEDPQPQQSDGGGNGEGEEESPQQGDGESEEPQPQPQQGEEPSQGNGDGNSEDEGKQEDSQQEQPQPQPQEQPQPQDEGEEEEEPKPLSVKGRKPPKSSTEGKMIARILAGLNNLWLFGPAGCGKTTVCHIVAEKLGLPCFVLSCCKDTDPAQVRGRIYPQPDESELIRYYERPSVVVLDEFTSCEDATAMLLNSALANGEILSATGRTVKRHPNCIIVATSNTTGEGGDEMYCGNNRLDASTLDRFAGSFIEVDYSKKYESQYDPECVEFIQKLRKIVEQSSLQHIVSTRLLQACHKMKAAGLNWQQEALASWSKQDRMVVKRTIDCISVDSTEEPTDEE